MLFIFTFIADGDKIASVTFITSSFELFFTFIFESILQLSFSKDFCSWIIFSPVLVSIFSSSVISFKLAKFFESGLFFKLVFSLQLSRKNKIIIIQITAKNHIHPKIRILFLLILLFLLSTVTKSSSNESLFHHSKAKGSSFLSIS
jgi:hypothetical protein